MKIENTQGTKKINLLGCVLAWQPGIDYKYYHDFSSSGKKDSFSSSEEKVK